MGALLIAVIYLAFISLGLPDSLLGSGWPIMQTDLGVPSSYAGYVSMSISFMTIISALVAPTIIRIVRTQWIVVFSILMTVVGLIGFSCSKSYAMLFIFVVPYGLGAGSVDSALNNYVAKHYSSSVMNFLHCFYGVGAMISPYIMSIALAKARWNEGYRWTAYIQSGIMIICLMSVPLWKKNITGEDNSEHDSAGIREALKIRGVIPTLIAFFAYCSGECTCFLWTSSYFIGTKNTISAETAAAFGSLIFGGLMFGRLISAFVSNKLGDRLLIRIGIAVEAVGLLFIFFSFDDYIPAAVGFAITGIGMGPVYPAIQHMAPGNFGKKNSAAVIGLQMASAYIGSTLMPMVFGLIQQAIGIWIMPVYLTIFAVINICMLEFAYKRIKIELL
ncbi:MFS transporter [Ruminococcus sp.]|uniref:MFS transporter n=1 Tax=Ruminococcus sp. TaxID=41978 RepID=UPI0025DD724C|nr:MFS transporter [Ruminococcus sp.]